MWIAFKKKKANNCAPIQIKVTDCLSSMWINMKVNNLIKTLYDSSIYWFPFKSGGIYLESRRLTPRSLNPNGRTSGDKFEHIYSNHWLFLKKKTKNKNPMLTQRRGQPGAQRYQQQQIHPTGLLDIDTYEHWSEK